MQFPLFCCSLCCICV